MNFTVDFLYNRTAAETSLTAHVGEFNATWTTYAGSTGGRVSTEALTKQYPPIGRLYPGGTAYTTAFTNGVPASLNYDVLGVLRTPNTGGEGISLIGWADPAAMTHYGVIIRPPGASDALIFKNVAGTFTTLGTFGRTWAKDDKVTLRLSTGSQKVYVNGTLLGQTTDTSIAPATLNAARAGVFLNNTIASGAGYEWNTFAAGDGFIVMPIVVTNVTATSVALSLTVVGGVGLTYQWHKGTAYDFTPGGGTAIAGATASTYTDNAATTTVAYYRCVVTDDLGRSQSSSTRPAAASRRAPLKICPIGDSTSFPSDQYNELHPPVEFTAAALEQRYGTGTSIVVNGSHFGALSADFVAGSSYLNAHRAACGGTFAGCWVPIRLGANDALGTANAAQYKDNLTSMIGVIVADGGKVILSYPIWRELNYTYGADVTARLNSYLPAIDQLINGTTVFLGDRRSYAESAAHPEWFLIYDGIHETLTGSMRMGDAEADAIADAMGFTSSTSTGNTVPISTSPIPLSTGNTFRK